MLILAIKTRVDYENCSKNKMIFPFSISSNILVMYHSFYLLYLTASIVYILNCSDDKNFYWRKNDSNVFEIWLQQRATIYTIV